MKNGCVAMEIKISQELFQLLNGNNIERKQHEAMMLLTVSEDFWPHAAMISVGEVVALTHSEFRLAIWPNTNTANNMIRTGQATLVIVYNAKAYYIRLSLQRLPELIINNISLERFAAHIVSLREDVAKYADILSGIQINLKDPETVIKRWEETTMALLVGP
ncbi:pyridoxamine 5'-phosphate oxidase family protein [Bacillus sp. Marseille-P3661]|uniref:pyridoxamine 5'-phosphate oxidase family protein n=1 Tax=Bacillus sp. Marseille-P3661 TaxID=1936234 RepID=UPI0021554DBE|nr:pyridoxamine 5'-phosphate oxidase family protein [Bacillus sp. Marseille-P3661]